jgi:ankyrin repeat protein
MIAKLWKYRLLLDPCTPADCESSDIICEMRIEENHQSYVGADKVEQEIFKCLQQYAKNGETNGDATRPEVLFQLAICYALAFGINEPSLEQASQYMEMAAEAGSLDAKSLIGHFVPLSCSSQGEAPHGSIEQKYQTWLFDAAVSGSKRALKSLDSFFPNKYKEAVDILRVQLESLNTTSETAQDVLGIFSEQQGNDSQRSYSREIPDLHILATRGDCDGLMSILRLPSADVQTTNGRGENPLICAMKAGRRDAAILLLEHGADPRSSDSSGATSLHCLIFMNESDMRSIGRKLKTAGADVNAKSTASLQSSKPLHEPELLPGTPLDWAVDTNDHEAVEVLMELGADPFLEPSGRPSALHRVARAHKHTLLDKLTAPARINSSNISRLCSSGFSPLYYALSPFGMYERFLEHREHQDNGRRQTLAQLIKCGADQDHTSQYCETAIYSAVKTNCLPSLEYLLGAEHPSVIVTKLKKTCGSGQFEPFRRAIYSGNERLFERVNEFITRHQPDDWIWHDPSNGHEWTVLHDCCFVPESRSVIIAEMILKCDSAEDMLVNKRANISGHEITPFQLAVMCSRFDLAETFRRHNADPLDGVGGRRFLGYLLQYQNCSEAEVARILKPINEDIEVRSARKMPHPARLLGPITYILENDEKWWKKDKIRKELEWPGKFDPDKLEEAAEKLDPIHEPKLIYSEVVRQYGSFILSPREGIEEQARYGSRWTTALDLALDVTISSPYTAQAEKVFSALLEKWNTREFVNFPHTHFVYNRRIFYDNLRRRDTLLHRAVRAGKIDLVSGLLEAGADVDMADNYWLSPLQLSRIVSPKRATSVTDKDRGSFWGRLIPTHEQSRRFKARQEDDVMLHIERELLMWKRVSRRHHFVLARALRELWWPWDEYEVDSFGFKHVLTILALIGAIVAAIALFRAAVTSWMSGPGKIPKLIDNFLDIVANHTDKAVGVLGDCFDACYFNGSDPYVYCGLEWISYLNTANMRLTAMSDFIVREQLDCYTLAVARNQSTESCRLGLDRETMFEEYKRQHYHGPDGGWDMGNFTSDVCTMETTYRVDCVNCPECHCEGEGDGELR